MPETSLALLSWSEQVPSPHTCCSKALSSERHQLAAIAIFIFQDITSKKFSFTSPNPHHQLGQRVQQQHLGNVCPQDTHPLPVTVSNQQTRLPGPCSCHPPFPGDPPLLLHCSSEILSQGDALSNVRSPALQAACKQTDWIQPKSTSQRLPKSRLWDYQG